MTALAYSTVDTDNINPEQPSKRLPRSFTLGVRILALAIRVLEQQTVGVRQPKDPQSNSIPLIQLLSDLSEAWVIVMLP